MLDLQKKKERILEEQWSVARDIDERSGWYMGEEIPFDVNVIGNREDYKFYICVKKM